MSIFKTGSQTIHSALNAMVTIKTQMEKGLDLLAEEDAVLAESANKIATKRSVLATDRSLAKECVANVNAILPNILH